MRNGAVGSPGSSWCERLKMTLIFLLLFLGHAAVGHEEEVRRYHDSIIPVIIISTLSPLQQLTVHIYFH